MTLVPLLWTSGVKKERMAGEKIATAEGDELEKGKRKRYKKILGENLTKRRWSEGLQ